MPRAKKVVVEDETGTGLVALGRRLVPEDWALWSPGTKGFGWVGRKARKGGHAPGDGPATWAPVVVREWLYPTVTPRAPAPLIACGVVAELVGNVGFTLKFTDLAALRRGAQ